MRRAILIVLLLSSVVLQAQTYRIAGVVVDESGHAQAGAQLVLRPSRDQHATPRTVETSADGHFVFDRLAADKYQLFATAKGFLQQGLNQHENFFSAVVTGPGKNSENVVFTLHRAATIRGVVIDEAGEPVREAQLRLFHRMNVGGEIRTVRSGFATTDERGSYAFRNLQPGSYFIAAIARPWYATDSRSTMRTWHVVQNGGARYTVPGQEEAIPDSATQSLDVAYPLTFFGGATEESDAREIRLRSGDRFQADLTLTAVPAAHLRFRGSHAGKGGLQVRLRRTVFNEPEHINTSMQNDGQGNSEINGVAPGVYDVIVSSFSFDGTGNYQERSSRTFPLEVTGDSDVDVDAISNVGAHVSGVVDVSGKKRSGRLFLMLRGSQGQSGTEVNDNGHFDLQNVKPGRYDVFLASNGNYSVEELAASGGGSVAEHQLVLRGGEVTLAVTASNQLADLSGIATDTDGTPYSGALILLVPNEKTLSLTRVRRDQSDSDGSFSLRGVPAGNYRLYALRNGWDVQWSDPAVLSRYRGVNLHVGDTTLAQLKPVVE